MGSEEGLKAAEARVRALTREVGTLREDLRREVKRRERAIVQVGYRVRDVSWMAPVCTTAAG